MAAHAFDRLGQQIEMLAGIKRHGHPGHGADLAAPEPGAVDHLLAGDVAASVFTPQPGRCLMSNPVTAVSSNTRAPLALAPLIRAAHRSDGLTRPSLGE